MPIYRKTINGRKVYWTRVSYKGLHTTRVCATREAAKDAEAELRDLLRKKAEQAEGGRPAARDHQGPLRGVRRGFGGPGQGR